MDNNELMFILRMRDEASAILEKATAGVREHGDEHDKSSKKLEGWRAVLSRATGGATSFGGALKNVAGSMISLGVPIAGGIVAANSLEAAYGKVVGVLREMIDNTIEYEKSQKSLSGALKVNSGIGLSKGQVNDVVDQISNDTLTDDTDVRNAAARMISIGRTTKETFEGAMRAAIQLSRVMGTDLPSAARLMARAMADPEQGMQMLRRAGVMLNENEKERIRLADLSGGRAQAQAEALKILTERVGNPASGMAGAGLSGALKQAAYAWDEFLDQFNDSILSKATEQIIRLSAETVKFFTIFKSQSTEDKTGAQTAMIKQLQSELDILSKKPIPTRGDQKYMEDLRKQIEAAKRALDELGKEAEQAIAKEMVGAINEAANATQNLLVQLGQVQLPSGQIVEQAVARADATVDGARKNLETIKKDYLAVFNSDVTTRADKEAAEQRLRAAEAAVQAAEGVARVAGEERKVTVELENQRKIASTGQANREAERAAIAAWEKSFGQFGDRGKADQAAQAARELVQIQERMRSGDLAAGTSREVQYQIALADAYGRSAQEASKLLYEQKAIEAAISGAGGADARELQTVEFFKALVGLAAETRKNVDALPELEAKVAASSSSTTAFAFQAYEQVLAKVRDLRATMLNDNSPEAQLQATKLLTEQTKALAEARSRAGLQIAQSSANEIARAKDEIELNNARIATASQSQRAAEVAIAMVEIEREKRKLLALDLSEEERAKRMLVLSQRASIAEELAKSNEEVRKAQGPLSQYLRDAAEPWRDYEQVAVSALNGVEDTLAGLLTGAKSWQEGFSDLINGIINDLAKLSIRAAITQPIVESLFGAGGSSASGGSVGSFLSKAASWIGGMFFEDGGIMTARGRVPLRQYGGGGVANSPQLAMFGEGSTPEAYVPVPSGRIPVELNGATRGVNMPTVINVNVNGGASGGYNDPSAIARQAQQIGAAVKAALNKHMQEQMRPGGMLAGGVV